MGGNEGILAGLLVLGVAAYVVLFTILLAAGAAVCWFLVSCLQEIPQKHRRHRPFLVWLLLIPIFNIVWSFFILPGIAKSFKSYFDASGLKGIGDCGLSTAWAFCILCTVLIPVELLGRCFLPGRLSACGLYVALPVLLTVTLVKFSGLKGEVKRR
ncbi:MAG: hypothetical protein WCL44_06000 [bacterium]